MMTASWAGLLDWRLFRITDGPFVSPQSRITSQKHREQISLAANCILLTAVKKTWCILQVIRQMPKCALGWSYPAPKYAENKAEVHKQRLSYCVILASCSCCFMGFCGQVVWLVALSPLASAGPIRLVLWKMLLYISWALHLISWAYLVIL